MVKICWTCDNCNYLTISDSKEHHKMDKCKCGECFCDLEEHYCRWLAKDFSKLRIIAKLKENKTWKNVRKGIVE